MSEVTSNSSKLKAFISCSRFLVWFKAIFLKIEWIWKNLLLKKNSIDYLRFTVFFFEKFSKIERVVSRTLKLKNFVIRTEILKEVGVW